MSASGEVLVEGKSGRIFTARIGRAGVYFYFEGHVDADMFASTMGPANAAVAHGGATLYGDGGEWKTYAAAYRKEWTQWFGKHRSQLDKTYLVTTSAILRMGVQVVNLFTQDSITALSSAHELYVKLRNDVPDLASHTSTWPADIARRTRL